MKFLLKVALFSMTAPVWANVITLAPHLDQSSAVVVSELSARGSHVQEVKFKLKQVRADSHQIHSQYKVLSEEGISFSQNIGEASLPFKAIVVAGKPQDIQVTVDKGMPVSVSMMAAPSQPEDCRCEDMKKKSWVPLKMTSTQMIKIESLGAYRGQDLSRVTIMGAEANVQTGTTTFYPELKAQIVSQKSLKNFFSADSQSSYDYLIVSPDALLSGIEEFVQYKTAAGYSVKVVKMEDIGKDVPKLTAFFKSEYDSNKYKYALIVGSEDLFPTHQVRTTGASKTPSDYTYFLMDSADMIPDVQYGRVVASSADEVSRQVQRWTDYQDRTSPASQYLKMIGIASNEGQNPSDDEYIRGIEADMNAGYGTVATHFYQNDPTNSAKTVNEALNKGTGFLVYMGHGSGTSWSAPAYKTSDVKKIENASVLKPILIDVACQNGILKKGYLGETFVNSVDSRGDNVGAAMYYGGSVNISWHPPAIMARGMVKKAIAQNLNVIGDVLLAGHIYLLENYTNLENVKDNFEWYHLFGEPSSPVHFK